MPYTLFHSRFPEIAEQETRTVTVFENSGFNIPPGDYNFLEMFCDEPDCDCRRVFLSVVSSNHKNILAVIAWGWEEQDYYVKWMGYNVPRIIRDLIGPTLNPASPQSKLAPALLDLFTKVLLEDSAYVDRIKRHYSMFRQTIKSKVRLSSGSGEKNLRKKRKKKKA